MLSLIYNWFWNFWVIAPVLFINWAKGSGRVWILIEHFFLFALCNICFDFVHVPSYFVMCSVHFFCSHKAISFLIIASLITILFLWWLVTVHWPLIVFFRSWMLWNFGRRLLLIEVFGEEASWLGTILINLWIIQINMNWKYVILFILLKDVLSFFRTLTIFKILLNIHIVWKIVWLGVFIFTWKVFIEYRVWRRYVLLIESFYLTMLWYRCRFIHF